MAFRALLFSKSPETAASLTAVFQDAGIRPEVCADIFAAIDKGTKQNFSCIVADWSDQPEAGFLLKRARESAANHNAVPIAIVDNEPAPAELRDNRLEFLLYRPIANEEARAVLAKACQQMQLQSAAVDTELGGSLQHSDGAAQSAEPEDPNLESIAGELPKSSPHPAQEDSLETEAADSVFLDASDTDESAPDEELPARHQHAFGFRAACALALVFAAVFFLWRSRETLQYLAHAREGTFHVLQESVAALFDTNRSGSQPVGSVISDAQQDAYFARTPGNANGQAPTLGVVSVEATLPEGSVRLPRAFDFPLPTPELAHQDAAPLRAERAHVPDSLRTSAPIGPPVVATNPAQIMPISAPTPQIPQFSEPVHLSEEAARALLVHSPDPVYPPEASAQKLQGAVVLQAMIGRDGSVKDLKIVRGYFVLGRAATAAVKQWRFQPYILNGRPAETQTVITINFSRPQG